MTIRNNQNVTQSTWIQIADYTVTPPRVYAESQHYTLQPGAVVVASIATWVDETVASRVTSVIWFPVAPPIVTNFQFNRNAPAERCGASAMPAGIRDGRLNDGPNELGAPLAAYCDGSDIAVWDIDAEGHGTLAFTAAHADIDAALADAAASGQNMVISEGAGNQLWALSSNELALVGPEILEPSKLYQFIMPVDTCAS